MARRKQARPDEIVEAALMAFAESGYAATTMANIAGRANITKGTIYLYFPSKEKLFNVLVRRHIADKLAAKISQCSDDDGDIPTIIKEFLDAVTDIVLTEEALTLSRIIVAEAREVPGLVQFWCTEVVDRLVTHIAMLIRHGIQRDAINRIEPEAAALLCLAPILYPLTWRATFGIDDGDLTGLRNTLGQQRAIILHGLRDDPARAWLAP